MKTSNFNEKCMDGVISIGDKIVLVGDAHLEVNLCVTHNPYISTTSSLYHSHIHN